MRLPAGQVLEEGAHGDALVQGGEIVGASGVEILGTLDAGLDAYDLGLRGAAQVFEPGLDGVHAGEAVAVGGAVLGAVGDHAGHGGA